MRAPWTSWKLKKLARLVEFSEARAYASLIQSAPASFREKHGLRAVTIGSAVAVMAEAVTNTLNMNRVIGLGVRETATAAMVAEIVALYTERDLSFGIEIGPCARPKDLPTLLRGHRIRCGVKTALHYRVAQPIAIEARGLKVVQASHGERETVADICADVFGMPPVARALIAATADIPEWRQWLAYEDGQPIAAALSYVSDGVAWLGWDATVPKFRRRGAQSSLIAHRVNEAVSAGCRYITTETAATGMETPDPSYCNYERLGFAVAYERATYIGLRTAKRSVATNRSRDLAA